MKRIYSFARTPAVRNYTISDLQELKITGKKLTMTNPTNADEIRACKDAGIDLFVVGMDQIDNVRAIAPTHFTRVGSKWAQFGSNEEILADAFEAMRRGGDMYYTLRSYEAMEMMSREGIPVQSHIGLIPTFSHYCGGLRGWGRKADEAMQIYDTLKRMEDAGVIAVEAECIAEEVLEVINKHDGGSGIIYCASRNGTERLAGRLTESGIKAAAYHAGLDTAIRTRNQEDFIHDEVQVVCATIAFGMGIDKPDVRFVIHHDLP